MSSDWNPGTADEEERLSQCVDRLAAEDGPADDAGIWPERLWGALVECGAPLWLLPPEFGGQGCARPLLLQRYARLTEGSLTASFILTQHDAAVRRLLIAPERPAAAHWLRLIGAGRAFTTVGISHLTTSRRYGPEALHAVETADGYRLDGMIPWVTGAERAQVLVTGATMADGRQILLALPTDRAGVAVRPSFPLAALQASCTAEVACTDVEVSGDELLAGPAADVLTDPSARGTGGLETSALALGQARVALAGLQAETPLRADLGEPVEALADAWTDLWRLFLLAADGQPDALTSPQIRTRSNTLVLRITQAYLAARKGSGFLRTDPAQRWARQALFFLVWSCPGPVAQANIRDLAGICSS